MIQFGSDYAFVSKRKVLEALLTLPDGLRPTHLAAGENDVGEALLSPDQCLDFLSAKTHGFYLKNNSIIYDFRFVAGKSVSCKAFFKRAEGLSKDLMIQLAAADPVFSYTCLSEEREYRNRLTKTLGASTLEAWVGRDPHKYIPGLYWLTIIPKALADRHDVPLTAIERVALEHIVLPGGQHFFRFYDKPDDWKSAVNINDLCAKTPGIFNIAKVASLAESVTTFAAVSEMLREWK